MQCISFLVSIYVYNYKAVRTVVSRKSEPKMRNTGGVFVMQSPVTRVSKIGHNEHTYKNLCMCVSSFLLLCQLLFCSIKIQI